MARFWRTCALLLPLLATGCSLIPEVAHQPVVHNPFPQLAKVAVAPFFNLSTEPTVDGRQFALAYFNELQLVQGFEVVPVGVVEKTMEQYRISLSGAEDARKLAQILGVDVVVIGAITDFSPYYPPRCTMQVEWYAANPGFHPIPPGYALPWGTTEEEYIPAPLVLESEFALARAQLRTQTPAFQPAPVLLPPEAEEVHTPKPLADPHQKEGTLMQHQEAVAGPLREPMLHDGTVDKPGPILRGAPLLGPGGLGPGGIGPAGAPPGVTGAIAQKLPADWPDPNGFVPPGPQPYPPVPIPTNEPVMKHTKTYNGQDSEFTSALESYVFFQTDGRAGSWQAYLQRSDDFIRFCCHMHIFELLSARGGAGETRVVWRWSNDRI